MNNTAYDIAILGAGESGTGTALLAKSKGLNPFVSDLGQIGEEYRAELENAGIDFEEGKHSESIILNASEIVKSPGIPDSVPLLKNAAEKGLSIISEIEFAARYYAGKIIAITGSNGKTTTTSLIHHVLVELGNKAALGGNIGKSFARLALENDSDVAVLELSSFQLDGIKEFRPDIAVITNITPDHLDRYEYQMENYVASKFRIAMNQRSEDVLICFEDGGVIEDFISTHELAPVVIPFSLDENRAEEFQIGEMQLKGPHNQLNTFAAVLAVSEYLGEHVDKEALIQALMSFSPIKHRLQDIGEINGVQFVNDSKATNTDAVYHALKSFEQPIIWIAGGVDKGNEYEDLEGVIEHVKALVCLGKDSTKIRNYYDDAFEHVVEAFSMEQAVDQAIALSQPGDVILLSPACASFDLFKNYEDRGDQFIAEVYKHMGVEM